MQTMIAKPQQVARQELELVTFRVGKLTFGIEIHHVKEINSHLVPTRAPHAHRAVLGVMNLRGDVITVVDLATLLKLPQRSEGARGKGVIVSVEGELVAVAVDQVEDVVTLERHELHPLPPNFRLGDSRVYQGVYPTEHGLVVLLDIVEAMEMHLQRESSSRS
ncbi:CheW protein [Pirellula staleyi DSM 6068]|uniref:CheW protein n=1 Tax=Pirellula staleyi (strain ATCC 27377 / DSM 6068 / ICPB 4128) TaxID=530564 RepID=D2R1M3_PIRSD|nr:chemotaxis protein CheW [Pirellula staleyi]ADB16742.1 CheW protein [Pirellula staleyi DSM 6068]